MEQNKQFCELNLNNMFLFAVTMEDPEICRAVLELIMDEPVSDINVKTERSIIYSSEYRCVRLDVFADDKEKLYNIEMQNQNEYNLPKRSRFHQGEIDLTALKPGQTFNDLKPTLIIFICTFDPFGDGLYKYTYETCCKETGKSLGDEVKKIFLNTKGKNCSEVSTGLINFLRYVEDSTDECVEQLSDATISNIHNRVKELKKDRKLEEKYMTIEEWVKSEGRRAYSDGLEKGLADGMAQGMAQGIEQGIEQGEAKATELMLDLISHMIADGMTEDVLRLANEPEFLDSMIDKYELRK